MDIPGKQSTGSQQSKGVQDIALPHSSAFFPSLLQFGTQDFMSLLSFPSLNENAACLFGESVKNISSFNLAQDESNKNKIVKLLNTPDPKYLDTIYRMKNSVDVSNLFVVFQYF